MKISLILQKNVCFDDLKLLHILDWTDRKKYEDGVHLKMMPIPKLSSGRQVAGIRQRDKGNGYILYIRTA